MSTGYPFEGGEIDSLDLKSLVVTRGARAREDGYKEFRDRCRTNPDLWPIFRFKPNLVVAAAVMFLHIAETDSCWSGRECCLLRAVSSSI
jgi:hypothetical protein